MEFDDLKRAWEECDKKLDASIHLNTRLLRSAVLETGDTVLDRLSHCGIDYTAPVVVVQKQLESLRIERRRTRKWMLWLAPLACSLLVIFGIKSVFGLDVYSVLGTAGLAVVVVFGLLAVAARIKRSCQVSEFDGEEMVGKLQATLLRVLRRHRVLRG